MQNSCYIQNMPFGTQESHPYMVYKLYFTPRNLETLMIETGLRLGALIENLEALQQMGIVSEIYKNYYIRSDTLEL